MALKLQRNLGSAPAHAQTFGWWPYFTLTRLHKFPAGSRLPATACFMGLLMGAYGASYRPPGQLLLDCFFWWLGNIVRHSAACVWNDICDRDLDRLVERTKNRPLAAGTVSLEGALGLLLPLIALTVWMLSLAGPAALRLGLIGIAFLDMPYPFMKRLTHWPQLWLGFALAWGVPVAWSSVTHGDLNVVTITALFLSQICWTILVDTIYACQDRKDDAVAGIKSTAVLFGRHIREILALIAALQVASLTVAGVTNKQGPSYFALTVGGTAVSLAYQLYIVDFDHAESCHKAFMANGDLCYLVWAGILGDYVLKSYR